MNSRRASSEKNTIADLTEFLWVTLFHKMPPPHVPDKSNVLRAKSLWAPPAIISFPSV